MKRIGSRCAPRLGVALAAFALVTGGWASSLQAAFSYAYAEQTLSGLTVTGTGLANAALTSTSTTASAVINGIGIGTNDPVDTLQAYQGAAPPAPQNSYVKYATAGGGPQPGDFTRGDALITGPAALFTTGTTASNVAESYISGATGTGLFTGSGSWTINGSFTSTGTSVTVGYNYANDIIAMISGNGSASASFKVVISIKDQHGHEVDANPSELNTALSSPPNGPEIITSGSSSATLSLAGLNAGDTYSISITGTELSAVSLAVPEPASLVLMGLGGGMIGLFQLRRRARKAG